MKQAERRLQLPGWRREKQILRSGDALGVAPRSMRENVPQMKRNLLGDCSVASLEDLGIKI